MSEPAQGVVTGVKSTGDVKPRKNSFQATASYNEYEGMEPGIQSAPAATGGVVVVERQVVGQQVFNNNTVRKI